MIINILIPISSQEFTDMLKKSKMLKVHVTHEENKRIISFQKGGEVKEFRHLFLQVFSDVLLDQVAPANVKLQRYDDSFEEYVDLSNEERLEEDLKLLALVSKQDRQVRIDSPFPLPPKPIWTPLKLYLSSSEMSF